MESYTREIEVATVRDRVRGLGGIRRKRTAGLAAPEATGHGCGWRCDVHSTREQRQS